MPPAWNGNSLLFSTRVDLAQAWGSRIFGVHEDGPFSGAESSSWRARGFIKRKVPIIVCGRTSRGLAVDESIVLIEDACARAIACFLKTVIAGSLLRRKRRQVQGAP